MKLSDLLASRKTLIRLATLANMAWAWQTISRFAGRIAVARLQGIVRLQGGPEDDPTQATLTAVTGSQSVIEEHFTDGDIMEMAEAVFLATDGGEHDITFALEEFAEHFLPPLREAFTRAHVAIDLDESPTGYQPH
ncbi:hypothetical protein OpiT1DRAFT_04093 [Opitutaceae bacterium TAV1]|nr:hypothetical protein OPIT5_06645 [Opitutaceae bacterium TAV5]EIP99571.1 hypothetical protein OpiT1DRAFT_04093 [Opitutaceae bacterium TAV1]